MGTAREPQPVKLIASLLTGDPTLLAGVKEALPAAFGPIDFESELWGCGQGRESVVDRACGGGQTLAIRKIAWGLGDLL